MIIELPEKFIFEQKREGQLAFIDNGILKMTKHTPFRRIMIELTYQIKGKEECKFCHKTVTEDGIEMTIDHLFPQDLGGPTITNNLVPACSICNGKKKNMTCEQYATFLGKKTEEEKKAYLAKLKEYQETLRQKKIYQIPKEWLTETTMEDIILNINLSENYREKRYKSYERYYLTYGILKSPIVLDRNNFLLDGFLQVMIAKNYNIKSVPTIVLENVEVLLRIKED